MTTHETRFTPELIEEYTSSGYWQNRIITDDLARHARETPDKVAIIDVHGQVTYAELADLVDRAALGLLELGVEPGDVVSFQLPNWIEFVVLHFAATRIGAVSNPLIPIYRDRDVTYMVRFAESKVLVVPRSFRNFDYPAMVTRLRDQWPALEHVLVVEGSTASDTGTSADDYPSWEAFMATPREQDAAARAALDERRPDPNDVTLIMFTSGTTGDPKGVMHTHNTLIAANAPLPQRLGVGADSIVHMASTCAHLTGLLYGARLPFSYGATLVLQEIWNKEQFVELVQEHGITYTSAATPFLHDLLTAANLDAADVSSLVRFCCMGAPIPPAIVREAHRRLPGLQVVGGWGQTEDALVTIGVPGDPEEKIVERDGRPWPGMEIRVMTLDGSAQMPPGEQGRLQVRGPFLFAGYLKQPEMTASLFEDAWFDTGDLAFIDADGYLRISGRTKDVIIRGGENIPVAYVENTLYEHPDIAQVAVVGIPDPRLQERAVACLVLKDGAPELTMAGLQRFLADKGVAKQYWPEVVKVVPAFPATPSGKIQKFKLRAQITEQAS